MGFIIHKEPRVDREIRIGYGSRPIQPKVSPPSTENKQGRKTMAEEKKLDKETGVKKISQEPANKQGPVGTGGEQPPARPAQPDQDVKIGGKEERNG